MEPRLWSRVAKSGIVLGVDPSLTHTALVLGTVDGDDSDRPNEVQSFKIKVALDKFEHTVARLTALSVRLDSILEAIEEDHGGPGVLVLENYGFGIQNSRPHSLGEWGGQVRLSAYRRGWVLVIAAIPTVKKFATGSGTAEKAKMMMEILDRWQFKASNDNEADAYALMRLGFVFRRRVLGLDVLKKDIEVVQKVEVCLPAD